MIILVPFFGDTKRFRPVLDKWIAGYKASGCKIPWFALSDGPEDYSLPCARVDIEPYRDLIREHHPFDHKGALLCAAALRFTEPLFIVDADAVFRQDPTAELAKLDGVQLAMPVDHGALVWFRTPNLEAPFADVRKSCAGVMFMGPYESRMAIVDGYRRAFLEMRQTIPWRPPLAHLLEQYSWSVVMHRLGPTWLPHSMNWSSRHLGDSPSVVIEHDYGFEKWNGAARLRNT